MDRVLSIPFRAARRTHRSPRPVTRFLVIAMLTLLIGGGGWLWVRDSSLVRVKDVRVTGLTASNAPDVRRALEGAASDMTTLNVDREALEGIAGQFPNIAAVEARSEFPHGLTIAVTERVPVARLEAAGASGMLSGDGRVLTGLRIKSSDLPTLRLSERPSSPVLSGPRARAVLAVLGAAPPELLRSMDSAEWGPRGVTIEADSGTRLYFGDASDQATKWESVARVLGDKELASIKSIDVRIAGRPSLVAELTPEALQRERATELPAGEGPAATPAPSTPTAPTPQAQAPPTPQTGATGGTGAVAPVP